MSDHGGGGSDGSINGGPDSAPDGGIARERGDVLTVPLGFDVPPGWRTVDPAAAGVPAAAFVLTRAATGGYTPNVTVGVTRRTEPVDVAAIADEALGRLTAAVGEVEVLNRDAWGTPGAPGMPGPSSIAAGVAAVAPGAAQRIRFTAPDRTGAVVPLEQSQVHLVMALGDAPDDELLVELACTCAADQIREVVPDFQRLVASLRVRGSSGEAHRKGR